MLLKSSYTYRVYPRKSLLTPWRTCKKLIYFLDKWCSSYWKIVFKFTFDWYSEVKIYTRINPIAFQIKKKSIMTTSLLCTPWIFTGSIISQIKSFCEINTTINSILYLPVQDPNSTPLICKSRSSVSCASFIDRNRFSNKSLYNMDFVLRTYYLWSCCCVSAPT